jgi:uncharacterized protein YjbI with pentapeptide repeats
MSQGAEIQGNRPETLLKRPVQVRFGHLATSLGKGTIAAAFGNWPGVAGSSIDAIKALGLKPQDAEAVAWLLVHRALLQAMSDLVKGYLPPNPDPAPDFKLLCEQLDHALENSALTLTPDFFEHPKRLNILAAVQTPYRQWLQMCGIPKDEASAIAHRLPSYFVFALNGQWLAHPDTYSVLRQQLNTPFTNATLEEQRQQLYNAWLQRQVEESMFAEAFGLEQVYVPLRAWYHRVREAEQESSNEQNERVVVELDDHLLTWLDAAQPTDAIRVISGGPGSGKSSFTKMFAARLAAQNTIPILFVPLHQFDPTGDLIQAIGNFIAYDPLLQSNPLKLPPTEPRRLIIFDGLDELAMQGQIAKDVSQAFVREVKGQLDRFNQRQTLLQVIISGREPAVQDNSSEFRKPHQILHLLPHFIPEKTRKRENDEPYVGEDASGTALLDKDRRQTWWQKYGQASGKSYTTMPSQLDRGNLVEITAQPLLNYLVALSYNPEKPESFAEDANLNQVYRQLLDAVYQRGYERQGTHRAIRDLEKKNFVRILEEVALAAWHGDGRTTTVGEIQKHCDSSGLKDLLEVFEEGAEAGVTRLLVAFYFRQSGTVRGNDRTFEFTHKSFGEYLTACRIVRAIKRIQKALDDRKADPDEGWNEREALVYWAEICGPSALDDYLLSFLRDQIRLQPLEQVERWQMTLARLFEFMLHHSMPMEKIPLSTFRELVAHARHAEETLCAALHACALVTKTVSTINWPNPEAMGNWLARIQGQRLSYNETLSGFRCLGLLNLSGCTFISRDLVIADLCSTDLSHADLSHADLSHADLSHADLSNADLSNADLRSANLTYANLSNANLRDANLRSANLSHAILSSTNLRDANLRGANLRGANLCDANLCDANLSDANLRGANLRSANLSDANLRSANLSHANLSHANLSDTNLSDTNLNDADLRNADLRDAHLDHANLNDANLGHANLSDTGNLTEDQLTQAKLCRTTIPNDITLDPNRDCEELGLDLEKGKLDETWRSLLMPFPPST